MYNNSVIHKEYGLISNIKYVLREEFGKDKVLLVLTVTGIILCPIVQYVWSFITKLVIDVVMKSGDWREIAIVVAWGTVLTLLSNIIFVYYEHERNWRYISLRLHFLIIKNRKTMNLKYEMLENQYVLDCIEKASEAVKDSNGIQGMMRKSADFLTLLSVVSVGLLIMGSLNIWLMVLLVFLAFLNFRINDKTGKITKQKIWDPMAVIWRKNAYLNRVSTDFSYAKDIRMFGIGGYIIDKYRDINKSIIRASKKNKKYWIVVGMFEAHMWFIIQCLLYGWLIYSVLIKDMPVGSFGLYLTSATTFFTYVSWLFACVSELNGMSRKIDDYRSYLEIEIKDSNKSVQVLKDYVIELRNVSFKYPGSEKYVLKNVNLKIKKGKRIAIVGLNGAGKTTLIKILMRLYDPTEGEVLFNNINIKEFGYKEYYSLFSTVFQDINIFSFPISSNVSMKNGAETDKKLVWDSIRKAGVEKKIKSLEKGIDTELLKVIYDDGTELSGGEKQKLVMARSLYKQGEFVILDEPTSALDAIAETKIYEEFDSIIGNRAAVFISHRLSSTKFCDEIVLLEKGRVIERGTHEELINKKGKYNELFCMQAKYYVDDKNVARRINE